MPVSHRPKEQKSSQGRGPRSRIRAKRQNFPTIDLMDTIVPLSRAVQLSGLSADSWRRHRRHQFIVLSPRRYGIRYRDAIMRAE